MLPAKPETQKFQSAANQEMDVRPGSWWRLANDDHAYSGMPAPDHGLVLMVQEVRVIDGEIHTIVFHPHPIWGNSRPRSGLKVLYEDLIQSFKHEPEGEDLREMEIAAVMGRVHAISDEMRTPPEPTLLLVRQKEEDAAKAAERAEKGEGPESDDNDAQTPNLPAARSQVPAALLPSQDVVEAQKTIETRIAAFEAQKNWITGKTQELKGQMDLVAAYQTEKVNTTLASISEETNRAEGLLQNVQTMRLFLGEDMAATELLSGSGADASEPLTFMQRMLYLDEEIIINDLLEGFSNDQMNPDNLAALFSKDFSLVERMLPYPRCAAIVRVRRNMREFDTEGLNIAQLFEIIEIMKADRRVHILVRDGERLNMITADKTTSGAERFFPSAQEINALFKSRSYYGQESREISPDQVEYSDARAEHDKRALFYKRFLILMWGMHERTDVFGPFMAKGANWLSETTHSERFRFIHDEEEVLPDGRSSVAQYVSDLNAGIVSGSRVIAYWGKVIDGRNAPALCETENYNRIWKQGVELAEDFSECLVFRDKASLAIKAPAIRQPWGKPAKPFEAKVTISEPVSLHGNSTREDIPRRDLASGLLCLDAATVADIEYYANSRAARKDYLQYAHLLNRARSILVADQEKAETLRAALMGEGHDEGREAFHKALRLWRTGNKWGWPETDTQKKTLLKLVARFGDIEGIRSLLECQEHLVRGGLKANGDVFALCDTARSELPDGTALPWLEERIIGNHKKGAVKKRSLRTWTELDESGEQTLMTWDKTLASFLERVAPSTEVERYAGMNKTRTETVRAWRAPRGLFDAANAGALDAIGNTYAVEDVRGCFDGTRESDLLLWLDDCYDEYRAPNGKVQKPKLIGSLGLATAIDQNGMPRAWVIDVEIEPDALVWHLGNNRDRVRRHVSRTYANPERVLEIIERSSPGIDLVPRRLGLRRNLERAWRPNLCLSFDTSHSRLHIDYRMDKRDERIGWREALAADFIDPDVTDGNGFMSSRRFSTGALMGAGRTIQLIAPAGAEETLDAIFRAGQIKQGK